MAVTFSCLSPQRLLGRRLSVSAHAGLRLTSVGCLWRPQGALLQTRLRLTSRPRLAVLSSGLSLAVSKFTGHVAVSSCFCFCFGIVAAAPGDGMAFLRLFMRRQLPVVVSHLARALRPVRAPGAGLHASARLRVAEKGPWGKTRGPEQYQLSDLDKADAMMLRKSHETGFLSWFRNGLLATGIGVISYVQSEVGREAGYAFFILGGVCVSFGGASYLGSLFALRRMMLLSVPALLLQCAAVGSVALFWLCAVSLYIGRLEVEIIHEDDGEEEDDAEEECRECRERREQGGYRGAHDRRKRDSEDNDGKGSGK